MMKNTGLTSVGHLLTGKNTSTDIKETCKNVTHILTASLSEKWINKTSGNWMFDQFFLIVVTIYLV